MHPLGRLLAFDEAKRLVLAALPPTSRTESAPLLAAQGRALAQAVTAPMDVPGFDRSAMDGYAVRAADTAQATEAAPRPLRLRGAIHAGDAAHARLQPGECIQIATGAPLPPGADAVVMVERTHPARDAVNIDAPVRPQENVTLRGSDIARGSQVLAAGAVLTPARLAVLAALGLGNAHVYHQPRVALLSTGSELREPGTPLTPGAIYDSNSTALSALLEAHGCLLHRTGIVPDDPRQVEEALERTGGADLVLATGSSSAGERDHLEPVLRRLGRIVFHGVEVRPGKPLLLAELGRTPIVGLAGNPASCLLMTYAVVLPALRRFQRLPLEWERRVSVPLAVPIESPPKKRHFLPVRLRDGRAESTYRESDMTTSLAHADGFIEIPEEVTHLDAGALVDVRLF